VGRKKAETDYSERRRLEGRSIAQPLYIVGEAGVGEPDGAIKVLGKKKREKKGLALKWGEGSLSRWGGDLELQALV